jgi:NADPH:quinone reductase-like Zn-dependent oxidoreductase
MTKTMRAARFDRYGGPDVLYLADVPVPVPGPGQVLVQVRAAGINPGEASIRSGALASRFPATFPSGCPGSVEVSDKQPLTWENSHD